MDAATMLPVPSLRQRRAATPASLTDEARRIVAALGATAMNIDGVLWVLFPTLALARDPRANLLPVHVPALAPQAASVVEDGGELGGFRAEGAFDQ